jgi:hypothetical protein
MDLKPGTRLRSQTCATEVIVVKPPAQAVDLRCGGSPMVPVGDPAEEQPLAPDHQDGTLLGKRYSDEEAGIELLCTKAGAGSLSLGDSPIRTKDAKPLPSSD